MHNLLAQLGKEIARKEYVHEPGKRQFLNDYKDICELLTTTTGSNRSFEEMYNLEFLRVRSNIGHPNIISSQGPLTFISPKLRLLHWSHCPMTCLHFTNDLKFLVELRMIGSELEKLWDGTKLLRNLKQMNLSNSTNLKELPNLSMATSLKELNLSGCSSLVKLPTSIGNITNLKELNLRKCLSLVELPSSIGNLTNLHHLDLRECSSLVELASSIGNLTNLKRLVLEECSSLVSLPQLPDSIRFLDAKDCESLEKLDCYKCNPDICLNFVNCFNLNKEARDLIIQKSTLQFVVLPGKEVPTCFSYRASGSSVTVKLNQKPLRTSTKFKACILFVNTGDNDPFYAYWYEISVYYTKKNKAFILLDNKGEHEVGIQEQGSVSCRIKAKHNIDFYNRCPILTEHLYIFEVEAEEVTSTELVFDFELCSCGKWEIKECGIIQLLEHHVDGDEKMCETRSDQL